MKDFRIRLITPWGKRRFDFAGAIISNELPLADAHALLCEFSPHEELLTFHGPRAWYNAEPRSYPQMGVTAVKSNRRFLKIVPPHQILFHSHEDPRYRVPHVTHSVEPTLLADREDRVDRAVAVVSNFGGRPRNRWPDVVIRNRFVTAAGVDLFGDRWKWSRYRRGILPFGRLPRTFRGDVPGGWSGNEKVELLSRYRMCVCLENTSEPFYFTEKFVGAVAAGCIPIYQAHPSVAEGVLSGARWVDPADFGFDPAATLAFARTLPRREIADQNLAWLAGDAAADTREDRVYHRIAKVLWTQYTGADDEGGG